MLKRSTLPSAQRRRRIRVQRPLQATVLQEQFSNLESSSISLTLARHKIERRSAHFSNHGRLSLLSWSFIPEELRGMHSFRTKQNNLANPTPLREFSPNTRISSTPTILTI